MKKYLFVFISLLFINSAFANEKLIIASSNRGIFDITFSEFAQNKGFLKKCNITAEHFWTSSGTESAQTVVSNSADIAVGPTFSLAMGLYQKGAPVRIVGTTFTGVDTYFYVKNDSSIKTVKDLNGKTAGYPNNGSMGDLMTKSLAKNSGVDIKGVTTGVNQVGNFTGVMTGQIDSSNAAIPNLLDKVISKEIRIIATNEYNPEYSNVSNRLVIVNSNTLYKKRKTVECWMSGVTDAIDYFFNEEKAAEEYAEMVGFSLASIKMSKTMLKREQFELYKLDGFEQATKDGLETRTISKPLTPEQMNELYVKLSR